MKESTADQIRMVVFVILAIAIFVGYAYFFKPPVQPPSPAQSAAQSAPAQAQARLPLPTAAPGKPTIIQAIQGSAEQTIVVESTLYRVELSNRGGVVRSWKLKNYLDDQKPAHPLDLVNPEVAAELGWPLSLMLSDAQLE